MEMFKLYKIFLALMPFLVLQVIANFPDNPKPCKFGDKTCIMNAIEYLMHEKSQGFASLNLIKTEPLRVAKIVMKQGAASPVNIDLTFTNNDGLWQRVGDKTRPLRYCTCSQFDRYYSIKGRVLVLPITGTGTSNITMINVKIHIQFTGAPTQKSDGIYMNVKDVRLQVDPSRMIFNFGNLFNGDKVLGNTMNNFLNENWKDIYEEVRTTFANAFAQIFTALIDKAFSKYPYEKYFSE